MRNRQSAQAMHGTVPDRQRTHASESDVRVDMTTLSRLVPLNTIGFSALEEVQRHTRAGHLSAGKTLFQRGSVDSWVYYLLDGTLELVFADGHAETLASDSQAACAPLVPGSPRRATAVARSSVRFLRIDGDLLEVLANPSSGEGYSVVEVGGNEGDEVDNRVLYEIYQDYMADRLELPNLPEIGTRIRKAVENPDVGAAEIARILQADPGLTARVVATANSAFYAAGNPIRHIRDAVVRIGLGATRDLVVSFTLKNLFQARHEAVKRRILDLWRHSSMVGAITFILARMTRQFDPEHALLAGLLHDIGAGALLMQMDHYPDLLEDPVRMEATLSSLRGEVGAMLLRKWNFSDDLVTVALESESWDRDHGPAADLCDLVIVAQLHGQIGAPESPSLPRFDRVPAFRRLHVGEVTENQSLRILESAKSEIAEMRRLLLG